MITKVSNGFFYFLGVPVVDNDPLGALSNSASPTPMQKSATASGELLLVGGGNANLNKRPSLQVQGNVYLLARHMQFPAKVQKKCLY